MSNQCSNLSNYRSFSFCTPFLTPLKPHINALRPFFPFQHNLILIGRRSRRKSSSLPLKVAAQSSSDIVLIATKEHHDGSLVFRFGDASEVVENDDVEEEIESQTEEESSVVNVLDGDQDTQVIIKTGGRGYDSIEGGLIEVVDGIRNVDIDSDVAESETNDIRDLRDCHAESSERFLDISEKEVLLSQSDAKMNDSLEVVESTLDEAKFCAQLDGEEGSDSTINLLDNIPNIEKSADPEGTPLKGSDDKTVDPSVSVELESMQVSQIADDLDKVETEDTKKSDTEDITPSAFPATVHISDIELKDAANKDVEEELKDMVIDEGTLIDELPASNPLGVQLMDAVKEDVEQELKDTNINEATIIDEMPSSDQLVVEPTLDEVSQLQSMKDEMQQMSIKNREENDVAHVMPVFCIEEAEIIVEEELIQPESDPLELEPTFQVLNIDLQDTMGQNLDDGVLPVDNEIMDPSVSVKLETIQVSDDEVADAIQPYTEDESHMVESKDTSEGDTKDLLPPATMHVSDVDMDERLQIMDLSEATCIDEMPTSDPLGAEPTLEVSTTEGMDVKDADMDERLQDMNISEANFIDEMPTSDSLAAEPTLEVSTAKGMNVKDADIDQRLQDMNISGATFIDEMPTSDPLGAEPTLEVSTAKGMDVKDADRDERLQDMNISEATFIDEMPTSDPLGAEPTLEVSTTKGMDVDMQERLQIMNVSGGTFIDEMPTSDPLGAEQTVEVSTTEGMDVKDLAVEDKLQLVSNVNMDENEIADVMPAEPILEEEVSQPHLTPVELKATMQVSVIKVQDVTGQNLDDEILQVINEDAGDSYIEDVEQSSHQLESQPVQEEGLKYSMLEQHAKSDAVERSNLLKQGAHDPLLEAERTEGIVGSSSALAEASEITAVLLAAEAEVEREEIYLTDDFLLSGAALLEHPFKALAGGDDAYFVAGSKWLGVSNGVSQWSFEGTDPGVYAQVLMKTCEEIVLDTSSVPMINPVELICRGVKETNMSGSANVLIANFNGQALHVAYIGDTGFLIIRHGTIYKKSSPLLHGFHFALQVEESDDPLQLVEEYLIELEVGDIVVSATDGLFDNLYEKEITMIVSKSLQAGMKPQEIANILATRAQEVGKSAFVRSPFSDAAQAAGYTGYAGGKPDNVAVIVSLVEKGSNLLAT